MTEQEAPERTRSRWHWLPWTLALVLVLGVIAWQIVERLVDIDQYRPQVEHAIEKFTGLPVSIGRLELAWRPAPCLSVFDVSIGKGEGGLRAATARIDVFPVLRELLSLRLEIENLELEELSVILPPSAERLQAEWRQIDEHIQAALRASGEPAPVVALKGWAIERAIAERATLRFGSETAEPLIANVTASGIGGPEIAIDLDAEYPSGGARLIGKLGIPMADGEQVRGKFTASGVRIAYWIPLPKLFYADWNAEIEVAGDLQTGVRADIDGTFEPLSKDALAGALTGHADIAPNGATAIQLEGRGKGMLFQASIGLFDGNPKLHIASLELRGDTLATLFAQASTDGGLRLQTTPDAVIDTRDLEFGIASREKLRLVGGHITARGVAARWRGKELTRDLRLDARAEDGAIRVAQLRGGAFDLRGLLTPDAGWHHLDALIAGAVTVSDPLLKVLQFPDAIRDAKGVIALDELRVTVPPPSGAPAPWSVRARLTDGSLRFASGAIADCVSGIQAQIGSGEGSSLRVEGRAQSAVLGPAKAAATIQPAQFRVDGNLTFDLAAAAGFVSDPAVQRQLGPVLAPYGISRFDVGAEWPHDSQRDILVRVERAGSPRLSAAFALSTERGRHPMADVDVNGVFPGEVLRDMLPEHAQISGSGSLHVRRSANAPTFAVEVDLAPLGIAIGEYVEKKAGEPLKARVEGRVTRADRAGEASWVPERLVISSAASSIPLAIENGELSARDLDVDLRAWSFLLVDPARVTGRLSGSWIGHAVRLQLSDVALHLPPDFDVDSASGEIAFEHPNWSVRDLRVRGGDSDATLSVAVANRRIDGQLTGANLDVDFVRAVRDQIDAFRSHEPSPTINGRVEIALDRVVGRRGEARQLTADLQVEDDDIHVHNLSFFAKEGGRVTGTVYVDIRTDGPDRLALDLELAELPGSVLELLFNDPRNLRGTYSGKLGFEAPLAGDLKLMMADASGSLTLSARNGSLGKLGFATKLVTVLRSTEALRMRLPAFQDEGLVFDTAKLDVAMESGVAAVRALDIESTSYAINASGEVNYREDRSKVPIEVNAIRGITGFVEWVPVAGDVLKIVDVRLVGTGSPWDMKVRIASITDQILGASMAGPKAVIKGIRDALSLFRRAEAEVETEVVPVPEPAPGSGSESTAPAPANESSPQ